jgi:hypothetical protein
MQPLGDHQGDSGLSVQQLPATLMCVCFIEMVDGKGCDI